MTSSIRIDQTTNHFPTIGEKALFLINNDNEWETLKAHLRSSGVTTNYAAKMKIISYLQSKNKTEDTALKVEDKVSDDTCTKEKIGGDGEFWEEVWTEMEPQRDVDILKPNASIHGQEKQKQPRRKSFQHLMGNLKEGYASLSNRSSQTDEDALILKASLQFQGDKNQPRRTSFQHLMGNLKEGYASLSNRSSQTDEDALILKASLQFQDDKNQPRRTSFRNLMGNLKESYASLSANASVQVQNEHRESSIKSRIAFARGA